MELERYYYTVRHLRPKQIIFQIYYRLKKYANIQEKELRKPAQAFPLRLSASIPAFTSFYGNRFVFLNKEKHISGDIDWNFNGHGKLWTYNLNYFDFLLQENLDVQTGIKLMHSLCVQRSSLRDGLEPYPISLRGINWIKFLSAHSIKDPQLDTALRKDYELLAHNIEYHLLGNHLLENGFSLLFGAYYFRDERLLGKAQKILYSELKEQVLKDGGHFEKSPMYHQILLFRLLDCINLLKNNDWKPDGLLRHLVEKSREMLGWLQAVTFANGDVPMVNDATEGIAPSSIALFRYAEKLSISPVFSALSDSGYRMLRLNRLQLFLDVGNIGPDYIPGHAHSDTFSFVLYADNKPIVVDAGTSTYERNVLRLQERSTAWHNTVVVGGKDQSDVWASFRVGRRARVHNLHETATRIVAQHDGYNWLGLVHERDWQWSENTVVISDTVEGTKSGDTACVAALHFHPDLHVTSHDNKILAGPVVISCQGHKRIAMDEYDLACGFNITRAATVARVHFHGRLTTTLTTLKAIPES